MEQGAPPHYPPPGQPVQPGYQPQPGQPGYQQPPPVYQPPAQHTQVVVQHVGPAMALRFGEAPVPMTCHYCNASVVTATSTKMGQMVFMWCCGICLIGCFVGGATWFGCCLIPMCISSLKNVQHHCPNCNRLVGTYERKL